MKAYDYIVIGAGTAGCVVAARLAEQADVKVLLLEAGPSDRHWTIRIPSAIGRNYEGGPFNWAFNSVPQKTLNNRSIFQPRGRVLGGSSSINGMVFLRGHALDYDRWEAEGADGWSYADVLPYFRRSERYLGTPSEYRGTDGPIAVRKGVASNPIDAALLQAGEQAGYPLTEDVNGFQQEGFGSWDMNIDGGVRANAAYAYLRRPESAPRIDIETRAFATRIIIDRMRATGVEYLKGGERMTATASREIILSGGPFHSPQVLMLSGIGPADHLRRHDIPVIVDSPGVGENLQDHMYMMIQYTSKVPCSFNPYARGPRMVLAGIEWFLTHGGPAASNHIEVGAFMRSRAGITHPDAQIHFRPLLLDSWKPSKHHGYNFGVSTMRATSRGTVRLKSANPLEAPLIDPNYLSTTEDMVDMRNCFKLTMEVAAQRAFDPFRDREVTPGVRLSSDSEIDAYIRANAASGYHPIGTCRMGKDRGAVCAPDLKVRGVENLRVVDSSAFPSEPSANTNAPSFMLGERAADLIRGGPLLPKSNLPSYLAANHPHAQR
ncbi:MAG: choline dehydrogenase [Alphaproteobacteria bacterium]